MSAVTGEKQYNCRNFSPISHFSWKFLHFCSFSKDAKVAYIVLIRLELLSRFTDGIDSDPKLFNIK